MTVDTCVVLIWNFLVWSYRKVWILHRHHFKFQQKTALILCGKYICEFQNRKTTEEKCCSKSDKYEEMLRFHEKKNLGNWQLLSHTKFRNVFLNPINREFSPNAMDATPCNSSFSTRFDHLQPYVLTYVNVTLFNSTEDFEVCLFTYLKPNFQVSIFMNRFPSLTSWGLCDIV